MLYATANYQDLLPSLSDSASGDSVMHIAGFVKLLFALVVAVPVWLFGLLIGLLVPRRKPVESASQVDATASRNAQAAISSRPLNDEELSSSPWASDDEDYYDGYIGSTGHHQLAPAGPTETHNTVHNNDSSSGSDIQQPPTPDRAGRITPTALGSLTGASLSTAGQHHGSKVSGSRQLRRSSGSGIDPASFGDPSATAPGHWYITKPDLYKFKDVLEGVEGKIMTGKLGPEWSLIMDKEVKGVVRYLSYMRPTEAGSTDYLSVTVIPDATAQEIHEFNLDDAGRVGWDPMLKATWPLGHRDLTTDEQLVIWLRSFPMGFLSDRIYAGIARKTFTEPGQPGILYGVSKVVKAPVAGAWAAEQFPGVIQTDNYFSAWRCRTVASPWAKPNDVAASNSSGLSGTPACELILLHHDELKVPEYLSRMAIKLGMWKFVQGMVDSAGSWLEERRTRVDPYQPDPAAACRQPAPPLTGAAAAAAATTHDAALHPVSHAGKGTIAAVSPAATLASAATMPPDMALEGSGNFDEDSVMSPRRFYAVPTAPDLLQLAQEAEGKGVGQHRHAVFVDASGTLDGLHHQQHEGGRRWGHRRGHSLEWEPRPGTPPLVQGSANVASRQHAARQAMGSAISRTVQQQQQQQQGQNKGLSIALGRVIGVMSLPVTLPIAIAQRIIGQVGNILSAGRANSDAPATAATAADGPAPGSQGPSSLSAGNVPGNTPQMVLSQAWPAGSDGGEAASQTEPGAVYGTIGSTILAGHASFGGQGPKLTVRARPAAAPVGKSVGFQPRMSKRSIARQVAVKGVVMTATVSILGLLVRGGVATRPAGSSSNKDKMQE